MFRGPAPSDFVQNLIHANSTEVDFATLSFKLNGTPNAPPPNQLSCERLMKTNLPLLILTIILLAAQSASAELIFTFADGGAGVTTITVSGDTATAAGSGGTDERDDIGFSIAGSGSLRQTGFSSRADTFEFVAIGSGNLTDTITLTSSNITGGSPTLIDGYQFDGSNFYLVMDGLANNGDTLSFAGSTDVTGSMAVDYSEFASLHGESISSSDFTTGHDNITFGFTSVPEPASTALFSLGLSFLLRRRRQS